MSLVHHGLDLFWMAGAPACSVPTRRPSVPAYRVGEPLQRGRRQWPTGSQFHHAWNGHELILFQPEIDEAMIQDVRYGEAEFAVIVRRPVIVLAYRFGASIPWSDTPYCWHLQPPHRRVLPAEPSSPEARALLWITLVGGGDGLIHAQRGMTLAPEFTRTLHRAIRAQARLPFDPDACTEAIARIFVARPTTTDRLPLACARTIGNQ